MTNSHAASVSEVRLAQALDAYLAALQAGTPPDKEEFLARYPELAEDLEACLASLEFIRRAAVKPSHPRPSGGSPLGADLPTRILGDFRILREIGRGGMGVVYEAEQQTLDRRVALKILPLAGALDPKQLQRFKNEARAAAHLHHPHIVPVHGVGCERSIHFYAMQYIEGQTVAEVIRELRQQAGKEERGPKTLMDGTTLEDRGPENISRSVTPRSSLLDPAQAAFFRTVATLGVQAAEALEHAHQQGVIHRDIKPANLLLEWRAGGVNSPTLWITDFGLARLQGDAGLTLSGDLLGTLPYMSPEQALGKGSLADPRTDLYSLGATLYELLALQPAYSGRDHQAVLRQIAEDEPIRPRALNYAVPADLETIVLKAMSKSADERYASAQELADDLRRYLEEKPIRARRPTLRQRAAKWTRRHKTVVRAVLLVALLAVAALAVSTSFIWQAKEDLNQANTELKEAFERERQHAYYQRVALAEREWSANNLSRALQLLDECPGDLRGWEWHYLNGLLHGRSSPVLRHEAAALCVAISPDGERVASGDQAGFINLWHARTGQLLQRIQAHAEHTRHVAFSPSGLRLASASWDGTVKVWDLETGRAVLALNGPHMHVDAVAFSPDGQLLAACGGNSQRGVVRLWDTATGQELRSWEGHAGEIWCLTFSPDGQQLATGSWFDGEVKLWDPDTGQQTRNLSGPLHYVETLAFSADGRFLVAGGGTKRPQVVQAWEPVRFQVRAAGSATEQSPIDGQIDGPTVAQVWDLTAEQPRDEAHPVLTLAGHLNGAGGVAFSPDSRRLATGGVDGIVKLWDLRTGQEAFTLRGHTNYIRSVRFSPDGQRLVTASHDGTVRLWDAAPLPADEISPEVLTLRGYPGGVKGVAFCPLGQCLAAIGSKGTVTVWDVGTWKELYTVDQHRGSTLAFSPDGRFLASGFPKKSVRVWDVTTGATNRILAGHTDGLTTIAFSPSGRQLASGSFDCTVRVWDVRTGREVQCLKGHNWVITGVAFSPDGLRVASAGADRTIRIWDVATGQEVQSLRRHHEDEVTGVAFSADGKLLVSGSADRTVRVWEANTLELRHLLRDPTGAVRSVAFSPDGRRLAWGSSDATVKVWDMPAERAGQVSQVNPLLHTLRGHTGWVNSVAFSPDGTQIASASADGTVKICQAPQVAEPAGGSAK
jgi:WD40 repeat protein/serine/threonine protein kinase